MNEWVHAASGWIVGGLSWLLVRVINRIDALETASAKHAIEIRDTRAAVGEARQALGLGSFPYSGD